MEAVAGLAQPSKKSISLLLGGSTGLSCTVTALSIQEAENSHCEHCRKASNLSNQKAAKRKKMACISFLPQTSHSGRNWMALIRVQNSSSKRLGIDFGSAANKVQESSYKESSAKDKQAAQSHLMLPLHYRAARKKQATQNKEQHQAHESAPTSC